MLPKVSFQGPVSWKPQKSFRPAKAFSVYLHLKKEFVHVPKTPCTKRTSVQIKNLWIKHLCNRKVRDFVTVLWAQKVSGAFKKRAPGLFVWFFRKRWQNEWPTLTNYIIIWVIDQRWHLDGWILAKFFFLDSISIHKNTNVNQLSWPNELMVNTGFIIWKKNTIFLWNTLGNSEWAK